ncbi:hypothetical protein BW014_28255 [Salmonella enterica]|nr:hypothetical protein [Salmonella enterica]ECT8481149.1 hypothetical protein [Salmonella enterica]
MKLFNFRQRTTAQTGTLKYSEYSIIPVVLKKESEETIKVNILLQSPLLKKISQTTDYFRSVHAGMMAG